MKQMRRTWDELYEAAKDVLNPRNISSIVEAGTHQTSPGGLCHPVRAVVYGSSGAEAGDDPGHTDLRCRDHCSRRQEQEIITIEDWILHSVDELETSPALFFILSTTV